MKRTYPLTILTFCGPRFEDHSLDISALPELLSYREALVEAAKEIYRKANPDRDRIPKGFEEGIVLKIGAFKPGSVEVPVFQEIECADDSIPFEPTEDNEVQQAARVIDMAIEAATRDLPPPENLPALVIPLVAKIGKTLRPDEQLLIGSAGKPLAATLDARTRERIAQWEERTYTDTVDLVGEVRAADLDGRKFSIRLDDDQRVKGQFAAGIESEILDAFHNHACRRLRVIGQGEFLRRDSSLNRILQVNTVELRDIGEEGPWDPNETPIWEQLVELGRQIPDEELDRLPTDGAENIDHYLYGASKKRK